MIDADELVGDRPRLDVLELLELPRSAPGRARPGRARSRAAVGGSAISTCPVGVWTTLRTLPLPYMCTPHGRHGSNEWTARMMSMPLKFSGPFSSKIGVFCTASSYGPGVP